MGMDAQAGAKASQPVATGKNQAIGDNAGEELGRPLDHVCPCLDCSIIGLAST